MFRHDCQMAINTARWTFAGWHDRLFAGTMLLVALAVIRAWLTDRSWTIAAWSALAAGFMIGAGVGRLVATRLAFHTLDGVLAADALQPETRRRYQIAWHAIGIAVLGMVALIARPSILIVSLPAYLAGALTTQLSGDFRMPEMMAGQSRPGRAIRAWLYRPAAGAVAAIALLLSCLPTRAFGTDALLAAVGIETVLLLLVLTIVDDAIVRFMAVAGHGSGRIVAYHGKSLASFIALAVPGCWLILGPAEAGIVAAASIAMLLFLTLRVLAYRLHGKRLADLLVSVLLGLFVLVAFSMPVALPVLAVAVVWPFQRRGSAKTWLLA